MKKEIGPELIDCLSQPTKKLKSNLSNILNTLCQDQIFPMIETIKILKFYLEQCDPSKNFSTKETTQAELVNIAHMKMNAIFTVKCIVTHCCSALSFAVIQAYILPIIKKDALYDCRESEEKRGLGYFINMLDNKCLKNQSVESLNSYGYNYVRLCIELIKIGSFIKPKRLYYYEQTKDLSEFSKAHESVYSNLFDIPQQLIYFKQDPSSLKAKFSSKLKHMSEQAVDQYCSCIDQIFSKQLKSGFKMSQDSVGFYQLDIQQLLKLGNCQLVQSTLDICNQALSQNKSTKIIINALRYIDNLLIAGNYQPAIFLHQNENIKQYVAAVIDIQDKENCNKSQFLSMKKGTTQQKQNLYNQFLCSLRFWAQGVSKFSVKNNKDFSKIFKYYYVLKNHYNIEFPSQDKLLDLLSESNNNFQKKIFLSEEILNDLQKDLQDEEEDQISIKFDIKKFLEEQNREKSRINQKSMLESSQHNKFQTSFHNHIYTSQNNEQLGQELLNISSIPRLSKNNLDQDNQILKENNSQYHFNKRETKNAPAQSQRSRKHIQKKQSDRKGPTNMRRSNKKIDDPQQTKNIQIADNMFINLNNYEEEIHIDQNDFAATRKFTNQSRSLKKPNQNSYSNISNQYKYEDIINQNQYKIKLIGNSGNSFSGGVKDTDSVSILDQQQDNRRSNFASTTKKLSLSNLSRCEDKNMLGLKNVSAVDSLAFIQNRSNDRQLSEIVEDGSVLQTQRMMAPSLLPLDTSSYPEQTQNNQLKNKMKKMKKPETFHEAISLNHDNKKNVEKYKKLFDLSQECRSLVKPSDGTSNSSLHLGANRSSISQKGSGIISNTSRKSEHHFGLSSNRSSFSKDNKEKERLMRLLEKNQRKNEQDFKAFQTVREKSLKKVYDKIGSLEKQKNDLSEVIRRKNDEISFLKEQQSTYKMSASSFNKQNQDYVLKKLADHTNNRSSSHMRPLSLRNRPQSNSSHLKVNLYGKFIDHQQYNKYFLKSKTEKERKLQMKNKQLLYHDKTIQIGCVGHRDSDNTLKIVLFITPEENISLESIQVIQKCNLKIVKQFKQVNCQDPFLIKQRQQQRFNYIIQVQQLPYSLPQIHVIYKQSANNKKYDAQLILPCPFHKFFSFKNTYDWENFKNEKIVRCREINYSRKILKSLDSLKDYFPNLEKLNNGLTNTFGEFVYGAYATYRGLSFPFKILIRQNQYFYIEVGLKQSLSESEMQIASFFIGTIGYFLKRDCQ